MSIPAHTYQHPLDKKFLDQIQQIPGMDAVIRELSGLYNEVYSQIELMSQSVLVTEKTFPTLNAAMPRICSMLGVECPKLFVQGDGMPNAYTTGIKKPVVVVTAGLLFRCSQKEIEGIIAHECGHIACNHLLYHNVLNTILSGVGMFSNVARVALSVASPLLFKWYRASEYSADRAAAVALGDPDAIQGGLFKLMTGRTDFQNEFDVQEICKQADDLDGYMDENFWKKFVGLSLNAFRTHPWTVFRIRELHRWTTAGELKKVLTDDDGRLITFENNGNVNDTLKGLNM